MKRLLTLFIVLALSCGAAFAQKKDSYKIRTVVIDPGHGGAKPGAQGGRSQEKNITLAVAKKLGQLISDNYPDVKVIYTRTTDVDISLAERAHIANRNKADLFISIHANSHPTSSPTGVETFVMGLSESRANLEVAKKENADILLEADYKTNKAYNGFDPNSEESYIIFSMVQNVYLERSLNFAQAIQNQYKQHLKTINRGVKQAELYVLYKTTCPSVLTEIGFISNPGEEGFMISEEGQAKIAICLFNAFMTYKATEEGSGKVVNPVINIKGYKSSTPQKEAAPKAQPQPDVVAEAAPAKEEAPAVETPAPKPEPAVKEPVKEPEPAVKEPVKEPEPAVKEPVKEPEPAVKEPVKEPEPAVKEPVKEPEPAVKEPVKEPEPAVKEPVKEPEPAVKEPVKEPEPAVKEPVKEPEPAVKEPVKEPEPVKEAPKPAEQPAAEPTTEPTPTPKAKPTPTPTLPVQEAQPGPKEEPKQEPKQEVKAEPIAPPVAETVPAEKPEEKPAEKPVEKKEMLQAPNNTASPTATQYYTVQFLSSGKRYKVGDPALRGVSDFQTYRKGKILAYITGRFSTMQEASEYCTHLKRTTGFSDAWPYLYKEPAENGTPVQPTKQQNNTVKPTPASGISYRVQFCTATTLMKGGDRALGGIKDIHTSTNGNLIVYSAGDYTTVQEAKRRCNTIKKTTKFKDAFVIAIYKGERISLEQAAQIEKKNRK